MGLLGWIYDQLCHADSLGRADLIFVLAGRRERKVFALRLFREGRAPALTLSVGRFEVRRFRELELPHPVDLLPEASTLLPPARHFFVRFENQQVCVERVRVRRFGTAGEIRALAGWLGSHPDVRSVLIVSSSVHLRRVHMCCRAMLPQGVQFRLIAVPDENSELNRENWWRTKGTRMLVLSEMVKLPVYRVVLVFGRMGIRSRTSRGAE